jgi:hypothetical protein
MDANCRDGIVSPLSILKNPMILMAGVAMLMMFGMPKLMENSTSPITISLTPQNTNDILTQTSGPRNPRRIRGTPEEQPHERTSERTGGEGRSSELRCCGLVGGCAGEETGGGAGCYEVIRRCRGWGVGIIDGEGV